MAARPTTVSTGNFHAAGMIKPEVRGGGTVFNYWHSRRPNSMNWSLFNLADFYFNRSGGPWSTSVKRRVHLLLNGIFRHYAFPIINLKRIQIEPIENPKRIQVEPIRIFSQTYRFYLMSANQNILLTCCRQTFQDNGDLWEQVCVLVYVFKTLFTTFWEVSPVLDLSASLIQRPLHECLAVSKNRPFCMTLQDIHL